LEAWQWVPRGLQPRSKSHCGPDTRGLTSGLLLKGMFFIEIFLSVLDAMMVAGCHVSYHMIAKIDVL
jgi:hypothetical protein